MKIFKIITLGAVLCFIGTSCSKKFVGIVEKQGVTTYQYGTHKVAGYAITSKTINLDDYVGKGVNVKGKKIKGYPVDGGPEYFEVVSISKTDPTATIDITYGSKQQIDGKLEKLEVTTWQYGSHMLAGYALTSKGIKLEKYEGKDVRIIGYEIDGYPVDGGPKYLEVTEIDFLVTGGDGEGHELGAKKDVEGLLEKMGTTTFMYGTHTADGYALTSKTINLDDFVGKVVMIEGRIIKGYPVDGGPVYIEVVSIKETTRPDE